MLTLRCEAIRVRFLGVGASPEKNQKGHATHFNLNLKLRACRSSSAAASYSYVIRTRSYRQLIDDVNQSLLAAQNFVLRSGRKKCNAARDATGLRVSITNQANNSNFFSAL